MYRTTSLSQLNLAVLRKAQKDRAAAERATSQQIAAAIAAGEDIAKRKQALPAEKTAAIIKRDKEINLGLELLNTNPSRAIMYRQDYHLSDKHLIDFRTTEGNNLLVLVISQGDSTTFKLIKHLFDLENTKNADGKTVLELIKAFKSSNPALYQEFKEAYDAEFISGKFKNLSKDVRALAAGLFGKNAASAATAAPARELTDAPAA